MNNNAAQRRLMDASTASEALMAMIDGARVNEYIDKNRERALHQTARRGHIQAVDVLLRYGAKPNLKDANGATALHHSYPHISCAQALLAAKADLRIKDRWGRTVRDIAKAHGQHPEFEAFIEQAYTALEAKRQRRALAKISKQAREHAPSGPVRKSPAPKM